MVVIYPLKTGTLRTRDCKGGFLLRCLFFIDGCPTLLVSSCGLPSVWLVSFILNSAFEA